MTYYICEFNIPVNSFQGDEQITPEYEYIALRSIKGVTDSVFNLIMEKRGTVKGIFGLSFEELTALGMPAAPAKSVSEGKYNKEFTDRQIYLAERNNIKIIVRESEAYPSLLKEIHFPPAYLYLKGDPSCLKEPAVGIVGSRKCSRAGMDYACKLAEDLAGVGIVVISGFAYGIDISAHLGAIKRGPTAAVLGNGLLKMYPDCNLKYAEKVIDSGGCFLTEFDFDIPPSPFNFPRRNRIISGLSLGVAVIEASKKSGSLITTRYALEQNRIVFAAPHFPTYKNSAGNGLIKDGAVLLETYLDIVKEFEYSLKLRLKPRETERTPFGEEFDSPLKKKIYGALSVEPLGINELCSKLKVGVVDIITAVAEMELEGHIVKGDGDRYVVSAHGIKNG